VLVESIADIDSLETLKKKLDVLNIKENNGWLNMDVLKSKKGGYYVGYSTWKPNKEVTTSQHSPDRELVDDLPF
jgi:hypothetical protein